MALTKITSNAFAASAVDSDAVGANTITTAKIADNNVTHAKLHTDMNFTGKTLTLSDDHLSGNKIHGGVISNFASTGIDDNASSTTVTITADGGVGIGTSTVANAKLEISGGGIDIQDSGYPRVRFYVGSTFKGGVEAVQNTGSMISTSVVNDLAIRSQSNMLFAAGGNTEHMRINSSGSVGIGTDNPSQKLHVNGSMIIQNGTTDPSLYIYGRNTDEHSAIRFASNTGTVTGSIMYYDTGMYFDASGANLNNSDLTILENGSVGIGESSPSYGLDVGLNRTLRLRHTAAGSAIRIGASDYDVNLIRFDGSSGQTDNSYYGGALRYMGSRSGDANSLSIFMDASLGTEVEAITIRQSGAIGIGTTSPISKLTIEDGLPGVASTNTGNVSIIYQGGDAAGDRGGGIDFRQRWWSGSTEVVKTGMISGYKTGGSGIHGGGLAFWTKPHSGSDLSHTMTLSGLGRVGIGNTTPSVKLDVRSSDDPTDGTLIFLRNEVSSGNGAFIRYDVNNVGDWAIGIPDNRNAFTIWKDQGNTGTEYFTLDNSGRMSSKQTGWMGPVFSWWTAGRSGTDDYLTIAKNGGVLNLRDYGPGRGSTRTNYNSLFHGGFLQKWDDEGVLSGSWSEARIWIYGSVANDTHDQRTVDLDIAKYHYSTNWQTTALATIDSEIDPDRGGRLFISTFFNIADGSNSTDVPGLGIRNNRTDYDFDVGGIWIQFRG